MANSITYYLITVVLNSGLSRRRVSRRRP